MNCPKKLGPMNSGYRYSQGQISIFPGKCPQDGAVTAKYCHMPTEVLCATEGTAIQYGGRETAPTILGNNYNKVNESRPYK